MISIPGIIFLQTSNLSRNPFSFQFCAKTSPLNEKIFMHIAFTILKVKLLLLLLVESSKQLIVKFPCDKGIESLAQNQIFKPQYL